MTDSEVQSFCFLPDTPLLIATWLLLCSWPRQSLACLVRTSRNTTVACSQRSQWKVLPLLYGSAACFLSRSQQVQNKVTTRFNKLIYICFKMYNAHCLIQGSGYPGASIYTYTALRQQWCQRVQEEQQSLRLLQRWEHKSNSFNLETMLRDHWKSLHREKSTKEDM